MMRPLARLVRLPVSIMVAVSAAFGYLLVRPVFDTELGLACMGTFWLASACSVLNQIQERDSDALLSRTAGRPLPMGQISVSVALCIALVCGAAAVACFLRLKVPALLWMTCGIVLSYNAVYTPLKRRTGFALLVGAVPGAMPPVMGWAAAGGSVADVAALAVFAVYYLWQVPHFWLRVERDAGEYVRAGLPIPVTVFGHERYRMLLRLWFHAYVAGILLLPLFARMQTPQMRVAMTLTAVSVFLLTGTVLYNGGKKGHRAAFQWVNASLAIVMCLLLADRLFAAYY